MHNEQKRIYIWNISNIILLLYFDINFYTRKEINKEKKITFVFSFSHWYDKLDKSLVVFNLFLLTLAG